MDLNLNSEQMGEVAQALAEVFTALENGTRSYRLIKHFKVSPLVQSFCMTVTYKEDRSNVSIGNKVITV